MSIFQNLIRSIVGFPTGTQEPISLNYMTLAFSGSLSPLEKEYQDDYFERSLSPFRFSLWLSLIFYNVFALLDAITVPAVKEYFWAIRFGLVTPVLVVVYILSYSRHFRKYWQIVIACIMYITGFGIIIMIVIGSKIGDYTYYAGLILIFIIGYSFIRARFIYASLAGWSIVVSYEIASIWMSNIPVATLISNNYFFISANFIGMVTSYFMELSSRKEFYTRKLLEQEKENVKNANNELEKRVQERTRQLSDANIELTQEIEIRRKYERERAELEKQLFHLQKMETIGTLAGGIAHDFNNILTPILGYTDMALEELPEESNLRFDMEQINRAALRGKDLVQQILTFSREVDFEKKPIQLQPIISEVLNLLKASFPPGIIIKKNLDTSVGTVLADPTHIHQIIMNLCTNASHAMKETGGILEVGLDALTVNPKMADKIPNLKKGDYIRLTIADTGYGMDQKTKERIFEPFFTRKEVGSGTGLGLSVVHGIINNYGGAITVDSTPGEGTTFTIFLPKYGLSTISSDKMNKKLVRGDEHILFVDDEQEITYMGKKMLENLGYKVTIKSDSMAALEEFLNNADIYSLVVTDQNMPQMKGTEMISKMKDVVPDLKVIIITGYADNLSEKEIARYGISEVILKPMVLDDFSKTIRKVLDQKDVKIA